MDWDPLSPAVVGLPWWVTREGGLRLDSNVRPGGILLTSSAAETVTDISLRFRDVVGDATYRVDVFSLADLPQTNVDASATIVPNEDVTMTNIVGTPTNTAGSRYTNIDEATLDTADYLAPTSNVATVIEVRGNSSAGLGAGTQVISVVTLSVVAEHVAGTGQSTFAGYVRISGTKYAGVVQNLGPLDGQTTLTWQWTTNPATGDAWTEAEWQAFDSTEEFGVDTTSTTVPSFRLYKMDLTATAVDDARVATGDATVSADGWTTFDLASDWSKADATDYVILCRRVGGSGSATLVSLDSETEMPGGQQSYRPTMVDGFITALGDVRTESHPFILHVAGAASADSQPYAQRVASAVYTGVTATQEITAPSTTSYQWVQILARSQGYTVPTEDLVVTLGGETKAFAPSKVADAPRAWHVLDGTLSAAVALTATTQYDITATCAAASGSGWEVVFLDADTPPVSGSTAGFGGTTDRGDTGTGEDDDLDLLIAIGTVPTAPAGFTATAAAIGVDLAWTITSLGADFDHYLIERLSGTVWEEIARVTTEAVNEFTDLEAKPEVVSSYRLRVRHTNGTISAPSADTATAPAVTVGLIASNVAGVTFEVEIEYQPSVSFPRDRAVTYRTGRRYAEVIEASEDRGVTLDGTLHLAPAEADQGIPAGWDDLRAILDENVTWALLTPWGDRLWVKVIVDSGLFLMPEFLTSPITFIEVTDVPPVVEVSA